MRQGIVVGAVIVAAAACGVGSESQDQVDDFSVGPADSARMAELQAELIEADRAFAASVRDHGLGAWLSTFTPSGMMISDGTVHAGQEGIRQAVLPWFADSLFAFTWEPTFSAVSRSGDLGYTVGSYEVTAEGDAGPVTGTGTYLTVWRRQPDGTWKVEADIGNPVGE